MTAKTKKILNIVLDVVIAIVLIFAAFLAIVSIRSKAKHYGQYTEIFGTAYLAVASDSMDAEKPAEYADKLEGFAKGDLISIKLVNEEQAKKLEVGDIITFQTSQIVDNAYVLNTHRIVAINSGEEGNATSYITKGDNNIANDLGFVLASEVIGVYQGKASGIGHVFLFMGSTTGFFVCIVLPTLLIVAYCVVNLILVIKKEKKVQTAEAELEQQAEKDAERERIRAELLAEMQAGKDAEKKEEPLEATEQQSNEEPKE